MAWKDEGPYYTWDTSYTSQAQAATRATELANQYKIFTTTQRTEEGEHEIITYNAIEEEHSSRCRCSKCNPDIP